MVLKLGSQTAALVLPDGFENRTSEARDAFIFDAVGEMSKGLRDRRSEQAGKLRRKYK